MNKISLMMAVGIFLSVYFLVIAAFNQDAKGQDLSNINLPEQAKVVRIDEKDLTLKELINIFNKFPEDTKFRLVAQGKGGKYLVPVKSFTWLQTENVIYLNSQ